MKTGCKDLIKKKKKAGHQWITVVILAIWETETGRITVPGRSRQIVFKTLSPN
jgi:hypothetical protein